MEITQKYQIKPSYIIAGENSAKRYIIKVSEMPDKDRPREKMLENGPKNLTITELLAIILGTGTKKEEVMSMSSRLLKEYGEKAISQQTDPQTLSKELKLPIVKACQLIACFELGKRLFSKKTTGGKNIRSARDVFDYLLDMRSLSKEQIRGLYLNNRYQLIHDEIISIGTSQASIVDVKEIFKPAIQSGASALILAHNHPSGSLTPGADDQEITARIKAAGELLGIELLDHVIITKTKFKSIL